MVSLEATRLISPTTALLTSSENSSAPTPRKLTSMGAMMGASELVSSLCRYSSKVSLRALGKLEVGAFSPRANAREKTTMLGY